MFFCISDEPHLARLLFFHQCYLPFTLPWAYYSCVSTCPDHVYISTTIVTSSRVSSRLSISSVLVIDILPVFLRLLCLLFLSGLLILSQNIQVYLGGKLLFLFYWCGWESIQIDPNMEWNKLNSNLSQHMKLTSTFHLSLCNQPHHQHWDLSCQPVISPAQVPNIVHAASSFIVGLLLWATASTAFRKPQNKRKIKAVWWRQRIV